MGETRLGEEGCMKKRRLITIVMILTISAMLVACKSEKNGEENGTTTAYFEAVVEEVNDTVLLVDALESESNIIGEITVPIDNSELYKVGDKIGVTFDGEIMESYPAQIRKPEKIEILSTDETMDDDNTTSKVMVAGPYGGISLDIPADWAYTCCEVDNENLYSVSYGIQFHPVDETEGFIELGYIPMFGVCGTGLEIENDTIANSDATIGYYDGSSNWTYVTFSGDKEKIVALAMDADAWDSSNMEEALSILDSLEFNQEELSGAICEYSEESFIEEYSLAVSAKNITSSGATIVFERTDPSITDELTFGEEFSIDKKVNDEWLEAEIVVEGDYGFHQVAHTIAIDEPTEYELDWEWLYGCLEPGEYRINLKVEEKSVSVHIVLR